MALTALEETILDLHDDGRTRNAIATELGVSFKRVDRIINNLSGDAAVDSRLERDMKRGSERLLQGIQRLRGSKAQPSTSRGKTNGI